MQMALCALVALVSACQSAPDPAQQRVQRARQMRDVSRMLDTLETTPARSTAGAMTPLPAAPAAPAATETPAADVAAAGGSRLWWPACIVAAMAALAGILWLRRRRASRVALPEAPSIASHFPDDARSVLPLSPQGTDESPAEAPADTMAPSHASNDDPAGDASPPGDAPVALPPDPSADDTRDETPEDPPCLPSLAERLQGPDMPAGLYLVGDPQFPRIRSVGDTGPAIDAWRSALAMAPGEDVPRVRWLTPALHVLRARQRPRVDAERLYASALAACDEALRTAPPLHRPHWAAQRLRIEFERIASLSGAQRLLALRELHAAQAEDACAGSAPVIDTWIDILLTWSSWLLGHGAVARLDDADALCARLAACADAPPGLAERRRGDILLARSERAASTDRLALLDQAHASLEQAFALDGDASTALALARCAHQRAVGLPPADAVDMCSVALTYAFIAGTHPAWKVDALERRLAIQLTYESLPGLSVQGNVAQSLQCELAALDARSEAARTAMAATRLREGDFAGAAALCEAAWHDGCSQPHVLDLWREACRGWASTASMPGHDPQALAHSVRQLAMARTQPVTSRGTS
jgi:hypothetical protein